MAPMPLFHNDTHSLVLSNGTVILAQRSDSPWAMDLNTLVTIVFGVISIAFQASHVFRGRTRMTKVSGATHYDVENSGEQHLDHRHGSWPGPWHTSYCWDVPHEGLRPGLGRTVLATPVRDAALRRAAHHDDFMQRGIRSLPEGHVHRRNPWRSSEWASAPNPRPVPTGPALQRHQTQRRQQGF